MAGRGAAALIPADPRRPPSPCGDGPAQPGTPSPRRAWEGGQRRGRRACLPACLLRGGGSPSPEGVPKPSAKLLLAVPPTALGPEEDQAPGALEQAPYPDDMTWEMGSQVLKARVEQSPQGNVQAALGAQALC